MATTRQQQPRRTTSSKISYAVINRFQGGITAQPDKVQIPDGFTPMARNVEWQEVGGFVVRQGVGPLLRDTLGEMNALGETPLVFMHFVQDASGTATFRSQYMVATAEGHVLVGVDSGPAVTGVAAGNWGRVATAGGALFTVGPPTMTAWDKNVYLSAGTQANTAAGNAMIRWTGDNPAIALGTAFNDDLTAPVGGNMPLARFSTAWAERFWTAVQLVGSVALVSRIRWSHPGHPEDWQTNDYIDVGQQGDAITAIAPMRDMLVIFKRSSTYALLGSGATNFRVVEISGTLGCTGQWTRDTNGTVVFWDPTVGACRFDGKAITNIFAPLRQYLADRPPSITKCGSIVTDGDRIYVLTDFVDPYGPRVPDPVAGRTATPDPQAVPLSPGQVTWQSLIDNNVTWDALSAVSWQSAAYSFYNIVWVFRPNCGWTSFSLNHPSGKSMTMLGQIRSRVSTSGAIDSNRRIVYGVGDPTLKLFLSDRFDDGADHFTTGVDAVEQPLDAFYMTSWIQGGLPGQTKRFKAPRIIQEADVPGVLLVDVFYDYNYDFLRRTLRVAALPDPNHPYSFDSYLVNKPGTIGRAKAVMLLLRPEAPRHWGVSSITIPVHPKVMR